MVVISRVSTKCYGPYIQDSTSTKKGLILDKSQYAKYRTNGTSGAIRQGVAKSHNQYSVHTGNSVRGNAIYSTSITYQYTKLLLWGRVMYLSTQFLLLDSSLFYNNS